MSHDPHLGFIVAAYALGLLIVAGMVVTILADYLNLKQALAILSARERHRDLDIHELNRRDLNPQNPDPESLT